MVARWSGHRGGRLCRFGSLKRAGLEQHCVHNVLQLAHAERVNVVGAGQQSEHERDSQVGRGEVRKQEFSVALRQPPSKVGQVTNVQDVFLAGNCLAKDYSGIRTARSGLWRRREEADEL